MHNLHFTLNINKLIAKYTRDDPVYKAVKSELIKNTTVLRYHLNYSGDDYKISNIWSSSRNGLIWAAIKPY
jgi:hypothetical protein